MPDAWLDAGEENCARLIGLIAQALDELAPGQTLGVAAYDPGAPFDIRAWCHMTGHQLLSATVEASRMEFVIEKTAS
ncbi:MAG: sulfurtransferase TusA family protein [Ardenticatenaceae bacterium]